MPGAAIAAGGATHVLPADEIAAALAALVGQNNRISRS
jgi:chemotaxis response regulator CheB